MIGANQYDLTWSHFEQLHKDKKQAFENLCRSLFKRELCLDGTILHSDPNHPGVEVEPVIAKDKRTKISFQAKHFDSDIGYHQIEESTNKTAQLYSGNLDIVYLYCNQDIKATCDSYKRIEKTLENAGIQLVLVTGQTILDQAMNYPPILSCYFGLDSLDEEWFRKNIELSLDNLGRRYNSLFNIDTDTQKKISLYLREKVGIETVNVKKKEFVKELINLRRRYDRKYKSEITTFIKWAKALADVDVKTFSQALNWKNRFEMECEESLSKLKNRKSEIDEKIKRLPYNALELQDLTDEKYEVEEILFVSSCLTFSVEEADIINCKVAIITGEMGTGKSQLLATAAKRMVENGRPALLLLGQTFISDESIENQIIQNLEGLSFGQNFESLVSVMDEKGQLVGEDAVIFIDAINESKNREVWKNGINRIIATLEQYNHVKLMISLRNGFEELTLSESVLAKKKSGDIVTINHTGFADESPERIYEFLSNYGIPFSPEYYLHSEMTNPLFLTWFCNTYNGEEQGLLKLIDNVLKQADQEGARGAGMCESTGMLKPLLYEMLDISEYKGLTKQTMLGLKVWGTYGVINKIGYLNAIERAGVLIAFVHDQEEIYYIGYNLLEEYLKAARIVDRENSKEKIIEYCEKVLLAIDDAGNIGNLGNENVFAMVASLFALKYGEELLTIIDKIGNERDKNYLVYKYYSSFIWRSSCITYDKFFEIINEYPVDSSAVWKVFIENAVKENSELNALGLTKLLSRYAINRRDFLWTMDINEFTKNERIVSLAYYIEAGNRLDGLSDNKACLLLITYTWMLSSSNRSLRDRVSKAMIEVLKEHFSVCMRLLKLFKDVNDPYIIQRLYGVVFGAVMKRMHENKAEFFELAKWIYTEIFDKDMIYPDILLRDYARLIVERFATEYPNEVDNIVLEKIKPPYKSKPIPIVDEMDYDAEKFKKMGLRPLLYSMKFDMKVKGVGLYGDFGRYVFQAALNHFMNLDIANIYYYALQYILNDLGYEPEYFAEYDQNRSEYNRYPRIKAERIGKKYQWIAMYNILARVSDTYNVKSWDWNDKIGHAYEGPWDPNVRDFDPTLNTKICVTDNIPQIVLPTYGEDIFCNVNASAADVEKWIAGDDKMFQDFPERFIQKDEQGREWVSLYISQENKFYPDEEEYFSVEFTKGEQRMWVIATMYILPGTKTVYSERDLVNSRFIMSGSSAMRSCRALFAREVAWGSGYKAESGKDIYEFDECPLETFSAAMNIMWETECDASQEEATSFVVPAGEIIQEMHLYEKNMNGIYYRNEEVVAMDLELLGNEHTELLIRRDVLDEYIEKTDAQAFWTVIGEKQYFLGGENQKLQKRAGYYVYGKGEISGTIYAVNDNLEINE